MKTPNSAERPAAARDERMVLVMSPDAFHANEQTEVSLFELWTALLRAKWLMVAVTAAFIVLGIAYALLATAWYRAEVVLIPATSKNSQGFAGQLGQLSGLANLAGITISGDNHSQEALAVLKSRELIREFVDEFDLLPVLFAKQWDPAKRAWKPTDPQDWPDMRDAIRYFERKVMHVQDDKKTGLVTLAVEWKDQKIAAQWANILAERVNNRMRERALRDAEANVKYLRSELETADVVSLQNSISRLLEQEMEKLMVARGSKEFAYRFVDHATTPKWRARPKRVQTVLLSAVLGLIVSVAFVLVRHTLGKYQSTADALADGARP